MTLHTLLNLIGFCFLGSAWIVHWTTDVSNEKILRSKIILAGIGMGVFISAIVVGLYQLYQHFVK